MRSKRCRVAYSTCECKGGARSMSGQPKVVQVRAVRSGSGQGACVWLRGGRRDRWGRGVRGRGKGG
eukprot:678141-Rhodomonas_salina.4